MRVFQYAVEALDRSGRRLLEIELVATMSMALIIKVTGTVYYSNVRFLLVRETH